MEKVPLCVVGCGGMGHRHIMAVKIFFSVCICCHSFSKKPVLF